MRGGLDPSKNTEDVAEERRKENCGEPPEWHMAGSRFGYEQEAKLRGSRGWFVAREDYCLGQTSTMGDIQRKEGE